jgi:hypothetical protein
VRLAHGKDCDYGAGVKVLWQAWISSQGACHEFPLPIFSYCENLTWINQPFRFAPSSCPTYHENVKFHMRWNASYTTCT